MTTPFFTKKLVGKEVFAVPNGNNILRSGNRDPFSQVIKINITKVSTKFVSLTRNGGSYEMRLRIHDNFLNQLNDPKANAGYDIYLTQEDLDAEIIKTRVQSKLRDYSFVNDITASQAIAIAKIMKWNVV